MNKRRYYVVMAGLGAAAIVALTLVFAVFSAGSDDGAGPEGATSAPTSDAESGGAVAESSGGPIEGIKVHGHWTIEIRDPGGSLVSRREFDNALVSSGRSMLGSLLGRTGAAGAWAVLISAPVQADRACTSDGTPSGTGFECQVVESTDPTTQPFAFKTLTVTVPNSGPDVDKVVLSGNATAVKNGSISLVQTRLALCSSATSPASCKTTTGVDNGNLFTSTTLGSPVAVIAGQQILVTVTIDYS